MEELEVQLPASPTTPSAASPLQLPRGPPPAMPVVNVRTPSPVPAAAPQLQSPQPSPPLSQSPEALSPLRGGLTHHGEAVWRQVELARKWVASQGAIMAASQQGLRTLAEARVGEVAVYTVEPRSPATNEDGFTESFLKQVMRLKVRRSTGRRFTC